MFDCGFGCGHLASLASGEIGEFQAAGVILVFRFILLVGRTGSGGAGSLEVEREFGLQPGDDGFK